MYGLIPINKPHEIDNVLGESPLHRKCVCNCIEDIWSGCWLVYIPELRVMEKQYSLCTIDVITFSKFMTLIGHRSVSISIFGTKGTVNIISAELLSGFVCYAKKTKQCMLKFLVKIIYTAFCCLSNPLAHLLSHSPILTCYLCSKAPKQTTCLPWVPPCHYTEALI